MDKKPLLLEANKQNRPFFLKKLKDQLGKNNATLKSSYVILS